MGKDGITYNDISSREDAKNYLFSAKVIEQTKDHYVTQGKTARQTIEGMSLSEWYEGNEGYFARAFSYYLPKHGNGRGGVRPNAGRPVGSKTCPGCGNLRKNCTCAERIHKKVDYEKILSVVTRPSGNNDGVYSAIVAFESKDGHYKASELPVSRFPIHADVMRAIRSGDELPPARARAYFQNQLDHELDQDDN